MGIRRGAKYIKIPFIAVHGRTKILLTFDVNACALSELYLYNFQADQKTENEMVNKSSVFKAQLTNKLGTWVTVSIPVELPENTEYLQVTVPYVGNSVTDGVFYLDNIKVECDHTVEIIPGKAATCTEDGLTDGGKCSVCGAITQVQQTITALGHSYGEGVVTTEPTYEAAGEMTYTCEVCGDTYTEEIPQLEMAVELAVTGRSLLVKDIIQMKYYFGYDENIDVVVTGAGLYIWNNEADAQAKNFATAIYTTTEFEDAGIYKGNQEYSLKTHGIPAKEMGDTVYVLGYVMIDGVAVYAPVNAYSPKAWCVSTMADTKASVNDKKIATALMNYGAAAQTYFDYKTDDLMNEGFDSFTFTADMCSMTSRLKGEGIFKETGISTILKGAVQYKVYYSAEGLEGKSGFGIEYRVGNGETVTVEEYEYDSKYNEYSFKVEGLAARKLDEVVTITPYYTENGEKVYGEPSTISAEFWVYGAMTSTKTTESALKDKAFAPAFGNYIKVASEVFD